MWKINNASRAKKINTSQNLSRLNLSAYNYFIANFGNSNHEIIRKVMILFQLYGLSKLLCDPLPYLKTKKNDLITTYAKRGTTTVHYLKLICDRRCATMSFVYFLNVWVINLDRKKERILNNGKWMKNRALPYPLFSLRGFKTFRPSVREKVFCRIITL